jgi:large repetitive protein
MKKLYLSVLLLTTIAFTACGGGGNSGTVAAPPPVPKIISITSDHLPDALQGQPYSTTLIASNGQGALNWTMTAISPTTLYPDGLSINSATGVVSGIANFQGGAGFTATVTDASSHTASKTLTIGGYGKLTAGAASNLTAWQYQNFYQFTSFQGGVPPLSYSIKSGALPPGLKVDSLGRIIGVAFSPGTYSAVVTARDSWSTPETADQVINMTVTGASLTAGGNVQNKLVVNQPITGKVYGVGGIPPYTFRVSFGVLPKGVSLDASTGAFLGNPTEITSTQSMVEVKDSAGSTAGAWIYFNIVTSTGRNDTPQTATQVINFPVQASLSPYLDPPDKAPLAADTDYYKLTSMAGSIVRITAIPTRGPIDPVVEVVDGNNVRPSACNVPASSSGGSYLTPCVGDDDSSGTHTASLDYKVPGAAGNVVNSYIHVLDWRGDARPDMQYLLDVTGNIEPIYARLGATRAVAYSYTFYQVYNQTIGTTTWTIDNGTLPDGLNMSSSGVITGTPTTDGEYSFRVKIVDSAVPARTFYIFVTMGVGEPVQITSASVWPTACVGKQYTFAVTASGGVTPLSWAINSMLWPGLILNQTTGSVSGISNITGTYSGTLFVTDAAGSRASQPISVTVQSCP